MTWDTIQQVLRIILYTAGGVLFGKAVTDGAQFQGLVGGILACASFAWWWFWDRKRTS